VRVAVVGATAGAVVDAAGGPAAEVDVDPADSGRVAEPTVEVVEPGTGAGAFGCDPPPQAASIKVKRAKVATAVGILIGASLTEPRHAKMGHVF
jgi:hypothetical protein